MSQETYPLDDAALDAVSAAGGHWVVNAKGTGQWHYNDVVASGNNVKCAASGESGSSSVRSEIRGNQRYVFGYDTAKGGEYLKGVRPV